jgi:hypothetical protein
VSFRDAAMVTGRCLYAPLHRVVAQAAKEREKELSNNTCSMYHSQRMCWIHILKMQYNPNEKVKAVQKIKFADTVSE